MAELKRESQNGFSAAVDALFQGMDHLVATKTVVGDAVKVDAAGTFAENAKNKGAGGMSAKLSPSAVLVIQNGSTRLVNIKNQNTVNKMLDMVPDLVNRFTNGKMNVGEEFSEDALKAAREMAEEEKDI